MNLNLGLQHYFLWEEEQQRGENIILRSKRKQNKQINQMKNHGISVEHGFEGKEIVPWFGGEGWESESTISSQNTQISGANGQGNTRPDPPRPTFVCVTKLKSKSLNVDFHFDFRVLNEPKRRHPSLPHHGVSTMGCFDFRLHCFWIHVFMIHSIHFIILNFSLISPIEYKDFFESLLV